MNWRQSAINSATLIFEKALSLSSGLILTILIARNYSQQDFGKFAFILATIAIFLPLSRMGMSNIVSRLFTKYPLNTKNILSNAVKIRLFGAFIGLTLSAVYLYYTNSDDIYLTLLCLFFSSFVVFNVSEFYFLAHNKVLTAIKVKVTIQLVFLIIKISYILNNSNIENVVLLHCFEYVVVGIVLYAIAFLNASKQPTMQRKQFSASLAKKGAWLLLSATASVLYLKIDQLMIHKMLGAESLALYSAATKLSELWFIFPVLIANGCQPLLVRIYNNKKHYNEVLLKILSIFTFASLIIICFTFLFGDELIALIFGTNFLASGSILSIHIIATLFVFHRAIFSKWLINEKLYQFSLTSHLSGGLVNIALNLFMIPAYGIQGAAWSSVIAYCMSGLLILLITNKTREFLIINLTAYYAWVKIVPYSILKLYKNKENFFGK